MIKKDPETYNELVYLNRMLSLVETCKLSQEKLDEIDSFINKDVNNKVIFNPDRNLRECRKI